MTKAERRQIVLKIADEIEELGSNNRYAHRIEISAHRLEDWGTRLRLLLTASRKELERKRGDIVNGNPAKYQ